MGEGRRQPNTARTYKDSTTAGRERWKSQAELLWPDVGLHRTRGTGVGVRPALLSHLDQSLQKGVGRAPAATRDMFHKEGNHISCPFCKMNSRGNEIRQVIKQFKKRKNKKEKKTLENLQLGYPKASESRMKSHILPRLSPGSGLWISALPNSRSPEQKIDVLLQHTHLKNPGFASGGATDWDLLPVVNSKECWSVKNKCIPRERHTIVYQFVRLGRPRRKM